MIYCIKTWDISLKTNLMFPRDYAMYQPNTPHYLHFVGFHDTISQPPIKKKTPATQAHAFSTSFSSASRLPLSGHFVRHQLPVGRTQGPGLRRFRRQNGCCHIRLQPGAANDRWPWGVHGIAGGEPKKPGIKGRNTKKHIYEVSCWILWTICPQKKLERVDLQISFEAHIQSSWVIQTGACRIVRNVHPETNQGNRKHRLTEKIAMFIESRGKCENSKKQATTKNEGFGHWSLQSAYTTLKFVYTTYNANSTCLYL